MTLGICIFGHISGSFRSNIQIDVAKMTDSVTKVTCAKKREITAMGNEKIRTD